MARVKKRKLPARDFWARTIPAMIRRGSVKPSELDLASDFKSCAVAEARANVTPRLVVSMERGRPADDKLSELGYQFYHELAETELENAARTYAQIQGRTRELELLRKFKVSE